MRVIGSKGNNTITKTATYQPNPLTMQNAGLASGMLQEAVAQPYSNMPVQPVAGFSPDQLAAFQRMQGLQGMDLPYFQAATNYGIQSGAPITADEVQNYFNPYFQQQLAALNDTLGAGERKASMADVATAGGFGDRTAVAQAERQRQYDLARGQLAGQTWQQALGAAEQDKQRQQALSALMASYGPAAVQSQLSQTGGLYNMGSQQQQLLQAMYNAPYQWQVGQFQYPSMLAQLGTQVTGGLAGGLGGTQTGTETYPQTSPLGSILGLGVAGLGAAGKLGWQPFAASGGRIGYADGGGPGSPEALMRFMDSMDQDRKNQQEAQSKTFSNLASGIDSLTKDFSKSRPSYYTGSVINPLEATQGAGLPPALEATGGIVHDNPYPLVPQGYQEGGPTDDLLFDPTSIGERGDMFAPPDAMTEMPAVKGDRLDIPSVAAASDPYSLRDKRVTYRHPDTGEVVDLPPEIAPAGLPSTVSAYARTPISAPDEEPTMPPPVGGGGQRGSPSGMGLPAIPDIPEMPNRGLATQPGWADFLMRLGAGMMAHSGERDARGLPRGGGWFGQLARAAGMGTEEASKAMDEARKANMEEWKNYTNAKMHLFNAQMAQMPYQRPTEYQRQELEIRKKQAEDLAAYRERMAGAPKGGYIWDDDLKQWVLPGGGGGGQEGARQIIKRGDEVPEPEAVGGLTPAAIKLHAAQFLQTGKMAPGFASQRDPVARQQRTAIQNYAADIATARGLSPEQATEMWRFAPRQAGWIMGVDGRQAGSLGTLIDHLDTLRGLSKALANGETQIPNRIMNKLKAQFGDAAPTNIILASQIVGAEVMKAVGAAGAGAEAERAAAATVGSIEKSPAQAEGGIDTVQKLAAGQLRTKQRQAQAIGLPEERLKALVGDRAWEILGSLDKAPPPVEGGKKVGDEKTFKDKSGKDVIGIWDGTKWVPKIP